ncbi:hypothetical protein LIER_28299 [Lithospermum erythrorhizon]|uniref:RNase H type-1 domain-containing protein n=1 Tax=Lithospermum erythrorhizon TaxID=34254 RepID=A0AAV3RF83_LITER
MEMKKNGELGRYAIGESSAGLKREECWKNVWRRPDAELVKINVDAAFWKTTNSGNLGVVCRLHNGSFGGAACYRITHVTSPLLAECLALRAGYVVAHWDYGGTMESTWLHNPPIWLLSALSHDLE